MGSLKVLIIAVLAGGVWGATWTPVNTGLPASSFGITALTVDPQVPSTLYALTTWGTIFKSADGAVTWSPVTGVAAVNWLVLDPKHSSTLYAATSHGILKSADGGASWISANTGLGDGNLFISMLAIDPVNPSTVYALMATRLQKTTNGGESWSVVYTVGSQNFPGWLTVDPATPSTLYITFSNGGSISKSMDGGESWAQIKPGVAQTGFASSAIQLAIDPEDSSIL
jgi:photosystem II stability/assembly factor-like uncharacterized protein